MSKCKECPEEEAVYLNMCESCLDGYIENLNCDLIELQAQLLASKKEANDLRLELMCVSLKKESE